MTQDEHKKYVEENKHKIEFPKSWLGFIPRRLEGDDSGVRLFSQNILFGRYTVRDGKPVRATALYEPDRSSFGNKKEEGILCFFMNYYNRLDRRAKITIKVCLPRGGADKVKYEATKYFEDKLIGMAEGPNDWERFFFQVSFLNFVNGERVEYEDL